MKRMFIGIKASEEIANLAEDFSRDKGNWPVRWITRENLHLTLIPPFEDALEKIILKLEHLKLPETPVILNYNKISFGPTKNKSRLIWATGEASEKLRELKQKIEQALEIPSQNQTFLPHLTLARFSRKDYVKLDKIKLDNAIEWEEKIFSIKIFKSKITPLGSSYPIIKDYDFGKNNNY